MDRAKLYRCIFLLCHFKLAERILVILLSDKFPRVELAEPIIMHYKIVME